jgi:hypothetical protein
MVALVVVWHVLAEVPELYGLRPHLFYGEFGPKGLQGKDEVNRPEQKL